MFDLVLLCRILCLHVDKCTFYIVFQKLKKHMILIFFRS